MSQATATVETLTATVNVLVVGNRQITLSVARQLDAVPLADLTVMGRVKISQGDHHVIGTDPQGGLAIAEYNPRIRLGISGDLMLHLEPEDVPGGLDVCRLDWRYGYSYHGSETSTWSGDKYYRLDMGRPVLANAKVVKICGASHKGTTACQPPGITPEITALLQRQHEGHLMTLKLHKAAAASPLIVLAGLK